MNITKRWEKIAAEKLATQLLVEGCVHLAHTQSTSMRLQCACVLLGVEQGHIKLYVLHAQCKHAHLQKVWGEMLLTEMKMASELT